MKKIFLIFLILFITILLFGNEKIVDIKFRSDEGRKFYPVDKEGNMSYGFYLYNIYKELIPPKDETIDPYNGKIDFNLIKKLAKHHKEMRWGGLAIGLGMGSGVLFTGGSVGCLYYATHITRIKTSLNTLLGLSIGITLLIGGIIEFILGSIAIGLTSYHGYHYKKTKKEIIDILNNNDITSIKTDNFKIKFCFNIDVYKNNLQFQY